MGNQQVEIGRDTIIALAAMAWADGNIADAEAAGMRSAAQQLGLQGEDLRAVEEALTRRVDVSEVETIKMGRLTRLFTYSVASWMASLDGGHLKPEEEVALRTLGDRLGLSNVARERATHVARSSASEQHLDLVTLKSKLSTGLSQVGDD